MKKVMSVNIGGLVFQIDNEAYARLESYLGALEKQFQGTLGSEEIIGDIEARIAEIFQDKMKAGRESIRLDDVDEVVQIMGAPKDLEQDREDPVSTATVSEPEPASVPTHETGTAGAPSGAPSGAPAGAPIGGGTTQSGPKRFFRNSDDKVLGGVCSGFATYIDADPLVVRLAFLLAVLGFGVGPVIYLILWIVVPEAKTTSEKLQMKGEKVTVDSIEKAIRKEADDLKRRFEGYRDDVKNNPDHPLNKAEKRGRDFFGEAGDSIGRLFRLAVKVFVGVVALIILVSVFSAIFGITGGLGYATFLFPGFLGLIFSSAAQANMMLIGLLAVICIPLIILAYKSVRFLLGLRVSTRALDNLFLVAWIAGLVTVLIAGARIGSEFQREVSYREEVPLRINPVQTIYLNKLELPQREFRNFRNRDNIEMDGVSFTEDSLFFEEMKLNINPSANERFSLFSLRKARGRDRDQAVENARSIEYRIRQRDSLLALGGEYSISKRAWRGQELILELEIPVGKRIVIDERLRPVLNNVRMKSYIEDGDLYNQPLIMSAAGLEPLPTENQ